MLWRSQRLYFATSTTKVNRLRATGVEDMFVNDAMGHSRARKIVLILDCCHSGAFARAKAEVDAMELGTFARKYQQ